MGQAVSSASLGELSVESLAVCVEGLGPKYQKYGEAIRENAVDGELLDSLDEYAFQETLEDLEVSRLHQRVLTKEWKRWKEQANVETSVQEKMAPSPPKREFPCANKDIARITATHPGWRFQHEISLTEEEKRQIVEAAASYELTEDTSAEELKGFDQIAITAQHKCNALYAGVHLLEDDGHMSLSSRFYSFQEDGSRQLQKARTHVPAEMSCCYGVILGETSDFCVKQIAPGGSPFQEPGQSCEYIAQILHPEGKRVGVVCCIVGNTDDEATTKKNHEERQAILQELAAQAEDQMLLRKTLLQRSKALKQQVQQLKVEETAVLPSYGPIRAITQTDLTKRGTPLYPTPTEIAASRKPRRTAHTAVAQVNRATTPEEMSHLPDNYYALADQMGVDHTPVAKDDQERIAILESIGLLEVTQDHPVGIALTRLVSLGARLFDVAWAEITFQDNKDHYTFARHIDCTPEQRDVIMKNYTTVSHDGEGNPWISKFPEGGKCLSMCSYTLSTKKTMVVHSVWEDESFSWIGQIDGCKFYSGSPVFVNGHVVATYCVLDFRTRPDFNQAHEMQQEQIAALISQQLESWIIRRDMERVETERRRLSATFLKTTPPDKYAAIVFTDVQGSTSLWEANSKAMNEALALHDQIMRKCIANHYGYEITTQGDAFHIAFHDAVDAVGYALEAQIALHEAPWTDDILALSEASDSGNGFRGLRVRMAIHTGTVASRDNEVSFRREYTGLTVGIAKSLEHMAHGGQILVSSDVWNVASHLSESKLGSPQVLDLGMHVLLKGKAKQDGLIAKNVLQVVPASLAFDYMKQRSLVVDARRETVLAKGRQFPPTITQRRLSVSFHEAPFTKNIVTMAFVHTSQIEAVCEDPSTVQAVLSKRISVMLTELPGYQCKDLMMVFSSPADAISFGLQVQDYLKDNLLANENLAGLVQIGVHEGAFASMGPHQTTGRADYFGKVVNRAARVAGAAAPGRVYWGIIGGDSEDSECVLQLGGGLRAELVDKRHLKGVQEEMALYECSRVE